MDKLCYILLFLSVCVSSYSQTHFTVTPAIEEAYRLTTSLRKSKAERLISQIKQDDPENMLVYHIENYLDFFTVFINEDKDVFKKLEKNKEARIKKIRTGPKDSPWLLFAEAEINLQWALVRTKFDEKLSAGREMYRAYSLLEQNKERHPDFIHNDKSLSIIHVLAKSIPSLIRKLFSIEGSIDLGTQEIKSLYNQSHEEQLLFHDEINIIYAYILFHQNNHKEEAWALLEKEYLGKEIDSPLISFVISNMAQKLGKNELAIKLLATRSNDEDQDPFLYLDFLLGKFLLYALSPDAEIYIQKYVDNFEGKHFIKEAYQKLAWYQLIIKDDLAAYKKYMKLLKEHGETLVDEDKQAQREAEKKEVPHPDLLKARLLFDGGYYAKAYNYLVKRAHLFQDQKEESLEYNYRLGRITHELKNYPDAIAYYGKTLNSDQNKSYFLCNSALQIGLIMESQGRYKEADKYLKKCLKLKSSKYRSSLHQKAKSARDRIAKFL